MPDIKKLLEDRIKLYYTISFFLLGTFAFFLLVKHDMGSFFTSGRSMRETRENMNTLQRTAAFRSYTYQFDQQFSEPSESGSLIEIVTDMAKKEGITLDVVKPLETNLVSGYRKVRVLAEASVPYTTLLSFLDSIEKHKKYIYIEHLDVAAGGSELGSGVMRPPISRGLPQSQQFNMRPEARLAKFSLVIALITP